MGIKGTRQNRICQVLVRTWLLFVPVSLLAGGPEFSFLITSDLGPNGLRSNRATIAAMATVATEINPAFMIQLGDFFHQNGVSSISDPRWNRLFEERTDEPSLQVPWLGILGNHEYRGNTQAVLDYSRVTSRWSIPGRYYTLVQQVNDSVSIRFIFLDTSPLLSTYNGNARKYPEATLQDARKQLQWADSVLAMSTEPLIIALGHHPVIDAGSVAESNRHPGLHPRPLMEELGKLLEKHGVDFYFSGHVHNIQHIGTKSSGVQHISVPSGSQPRAARSAHGSRLDARELSDPSILFYQKAKGFVQCDIEGATFSLTVQNTNLQTIFSIKKDFSNKLNKTAPFLGKKG